MSSSPGGPVPLPTATPSAEPPFTNAPPPAPLPQQGPAEPAILDSVPLTGQEITTGKAPKKLFRLDEAIPVVTARVHLPHLYKDHEPWIFEFRVAFSAHMQKRRDDFLALPPSKQVEGTEQELLDECADLLARDPSGFGDWPEGPQSPGDKLRIYYEMARRHPVAFPIINSILEAANNIYWATVTPREFFPPPTDNRA